MQLRPMPLLSGSLSCGLALSVLALAAAPTAAQAPNQKQAKRTTGAQRYRDYMATHPAPIDEESDTFHDIKPFDAFRHFMSTRAHNGRVDWNALARGHRQAGSLHKAAFAAAARGGLKSNPFQSSAVRPLAGGTTGPGQPLPIPPTGWQWVGPNNAESTSQFGSGLGFYTGRVNGVAIDPNNSQVLYVASAGGGIWKSVNGGQHWVPMTDGNVIATGGPVGPSLSGLGIGANIAIGGGSMTALSNLVFTSVVVDPFDSNHVIASTGDYDYTAGIALPVYDDVVGNPAVLGSGLLESHNGGATWSVILGAQTGGHVVRAMLFDPIHPGHILVGLGRDVDVATIINYSAGFAVTPPQSSILQTTDGGASWQTVKDQSNSPLSIPGYVSKLVYNSDNTLIYASADFAGVYVSNDAGNTWSHIDGIATAGPAPVDNGTGFDTARVDVAASLLDPNTVYILSENDFALYKSTDGGQTWTDVSQNGLSGTLINDVAAQGWYDFNLATSKSTTYNGDPGSEPPPTTVNNDVVYVSLRGIYQSPDGGNSWNDITFTYTGNDQIHTDQHSFTVNPKDPNDVIAGNDGGVYRARFKPDKNVVNWSNLNSDLHVSELYAASAYTIDPANTAVIANLQDNGSPQVTGDLTNPSLLYWTPARGGDGMDSWINPTNFHNRYTSTPGGFFVQTDDDWNTYTTGIFFGTIWISPIAPSDNAEFLFSGSTTFDLYDYGPASTYPQKPGKVVTGPNVQVPKNPGSIDYSNGIVSAVAGSPIGFSGTQIGFVGTTDGVLWAMQWIGGGAGGAFEISDANDLANPFALPPQPVSAIAASGTNINRVFVGLGATGTSDRPLHHLFRCDNYFATPPQYFPIDGSEGDGFHVLPDLPVNSLVVLPNDDEKTLFAATDAGIFYTVDGGLNWNSAMVIPGTSPSQAMPNVLVSKLIYEPSTSSLFAASYGRGLYRCTLGATQPLQILPRIPNYIGTRSRLAAKLDMFHAGQNVTEETTAIVYDPNTGSALAPYKYQTIPTETRKINLTPGGFVSLSVNSKGAFDVYLTVDHCLRKKVPGVNTKRLGVTQTSLILGDVDGDNVIDITDLLQIRASLGMKTKTALDVDGDGKVDLRDYNLVRAAIIKYGGGVQGD